MVMVQDLQSAKYDGMPRSAIASGLADYVLPPEKWLRMDGAPAELVISATPILFKKQHSALVFVREKL